ncbi:MAG: rhomboid family intramembrane serine protease [Sumerlaeia bacterium]
MRHGQYGIGPLGGSMPPVTLTLLIANVAVFLLQSLPLVNQIGMLEPGDVVRGQVWQLVTYGFLHGSLGHILANGLALFFFGPIVERYLGKGKYLALIFSAILTAGIAHTVIYLIAGYPSVGLVGFSGAVFAILVVALFVAPDSTVLLYAIIPMKLKTMVILFLAWEVWMTFAQGLAGQVSHIGHLAGAVIGFAFMLAPRFLGGGGGGGRGRRRFSPKEKSQRLSMGHPGRSKNASDLYDDPHWKLDQ